LQGNIKYIDGRPEVVSEDRSHNNSQIKTPWDLNTQMFTTYFHLVQDSTLPMTFPSPSRASINSLYIREEGKAGSRNIEDKPARCSLSSFITF
jgi:hypothetical protein